MNRVNLVNTVSEYLSRLRVEVEQRNLLNLQDINIHAETFFRHLLNLVLDLNLQNLNVVQRNAMAVDLGDESRRIAIQVTSSSSFAKIKQTHRDFVTAGLDSKYSKLIVLIIGVRKKYKETSLGGRGQFRMPLSDVWDIPYLLRHIQDLEIDKLQRCCDFLEHELRVVEPRDADSIPIHSTVPALQRRLVGRKSELGRIGEYLGSRMSQEAVVVLHGAPGVGKSELAFEFARQSRKSYPGGTFVLDAGDRGLSIGLARLGQVVLDLTSPDGMSMEDQAVRVLHTISKFRTLLVYDNVQSEEAIRPWVPRSGMLCHVLITTLSDRWEPGWETIEVAPLNRRQAMALVKERIGPGLAYRHGRGLVDVADGLPVQLVPACAAVWYENRRYPSGAGVLASLTKQARGSFDAVYRLLNVSAQLLLHTAAQMTPSRIPSTELQLQLIEALGWSADEFQHHVDSCLELQILQGTKEVRIHQLMSTFLGEMALTDEIAHAVKNIRKVQANRLIALARELLRGTDWTRLAALMTTYRLDPQRWLSVGDAISAHDCDTIGNALRSIGLFETAQPWFERAVDVKEQGEAEGRVEPADLGASLHGVGMCMLERGEFEAAQSWFERAIVAKERGDLNGKVDHNSLSDSLHEMGFCRSELGQFAEAKPWFERAAAASRKGNLDGKVDYASVGESLHQVGVCLAQLEEFKNALKWFKRAATACKRGNLTLTVDHTAVGKVLHQVGFCLVRLGQFQQALRWFEDAATEGKIGDSRLRIDHTSVGVALYMAGWCCEKLDRLDEAFNWFKDAIATVEKGDLHSRIDHELLGKCLDHVGRCLIKRGAPSNAHSWIEKAVDAKLKGDVHRRVNQNSVGESLYELGVCLLEKGDVGLAESQFRRAVDARANGDIHGRIDCVGLRDSLYKVGECLSKQGKAREAQSWFRRAGGAQA
ncbi:MULTISPECIES: SMEK domain-containing protein [unclassified Mesorhizobium]|uniref:SMEK domain-containing protein n=1 Tax=unclassified Mesorhizobium TaxID=325217 RepID=UPI0010937D7C|nr:MULTISPECIES: SMEK domain-containing protein [unclassified Mesorhizobium]TGS46278.1 tetratricopeptide repeat protein [Mesorhizobium sp. M8A.F.Ca.ET.182.01.1.1]TGS81736.1 tetratricopeptide repeat protein [Mesorhizobium sp. M8A.F.Ca.ET.181.01.1.1]